MARSAVLWSCRVVFAVLMVSSLRLAGREPFVVPRYFAQKHFNGPRIKNDVVQRE